MGKRKEMKKTGKLKRFLKDVSLIHVLRVGFIIFLAMMIVYLYYLQTEDMLLEAISSLVYPPSKFILTFIMNYPFIVLGTVLYSSLFFYFGFIMGRKQNAKETETAIKRIASVFFKR